MKEGILTKSAKKKIEQCFSHIAIGFKLRGLCGILGFIASQVVWVWILDIFINVFYKWLTTTTNANLVKLEFIEMFWVIYFCWFTINLAIKYLNAITKIKNEDGIK